MIHNAFLYRGGGSDGPFIEGLPLGPTNCGFAAPLRYFSKKGSRKKETSTKPTRIARRITKANLILAFTSITLPIFLCPREESNPDYELRKLASYPLNDEGSLFQSLKSQKPFQRIYQRLFPFRFRQELSESALYFLKPVPGQEHSDIRPEPAPKV